MKRLVFAAALFAATPSLAQQQPDPAFMQKAIAALQQQRNAAMDGQAALQAKVDQLNEEVAALKKQVEEAKKHDQGQAK